MRCSPDDLCLELLEVGDALEALLDYLKNNPAPSPEFIQRLPRSMGASHRKFLGVLAKRQVLPIELVGTQPDFNTVPRGRSRSTFRSTRSDNY